MVVEYIKSFFPSNKDSAIVLTGTFLNITAGGLFFILAPRLLGPANFGLFSTIVAIGLLAASIANFGIDTGILKFASGDKEKSDKILSMAFKMYLALGLATSILGILLANIIARLLNHPELGQLLQIAFSATIFLLLTNFYVASLQAKKEFARAALVNLSSNVARIVVLIILSLILTISLNIITALFFFITIVSVVVGKMLLPFKLQSTTKDEVAKFIKFNFFVAGALIISSIPFDNLFLLKIAGPVQTGLYAAPFKFLTFAYQFGGNISKVIGINFSGSTSRIELYKSVKNAIAIILLLISGLAVVWICSPLINRLFGSQFSGSLQVLQILLLGFAFFFLSIIPSTLILYYFGKSEISFLITIIKYGFYLIVLVVLIPPLKAQGAAWAFTASEFFSFLLMCAYVLRKLSSENGS